MATATLVGKAEARRRALESIARLEAELRQEPADHHDHCPKDAGVLTPVNTGQAVRNYVWTIGTPNEVTAGDRQWPARPDQLDAAGAEPRRHANEEAADATCSRSNGEPVPDLHLLERVAGHRGAGAWHPSGTAVEVPFAERHVRPRPGVHRHHR
jgi:hypothetical protein